VIGLTGIRIIAEKIMRPVPRNYVIGAVSKNALYAPQQIRRMYIVVAQKGYILARSLCQGKFPAVWHGKDSIRFHVSDAVISKIIN
jgi:hypothetical protein